MHVELPKIESRRAAHDDNDKSIIDIVAIKATFLKEVKSKDNTFFTL